MTRYTILRFAPSRPGNKHRNPISTGVALAHISLLIKTHASVEPMYSFTLRDGFNSAKNIMNDVIIESLDVQSLASNSTTFRIADLGCSVGPNTFLAMKNIIEVVEYKYQSQIGIDSPKLEFQVFFNDQTANDFNTLFASLPIDRQYFVSGVPGSFYDRLFPNSSISLAYSSSAVHWLSKVPKELLDKKSPAWNKGKIHYTGASDAVIKAYMDQYEKDMDVFLSARAKEIVPGGMFVNIMPGVPDGVITHDVGVAFCFLESILGDMVEEGLLNQDLVDSFNIPHVYPSVKEMTRLVNKNGAFSVVKMELRNARTNMNSPIDPEIAVMHLRALAEGTFTHHFGSETVDEVFKRAMEKKAKFSYMLDTAGIEIGAQLFAVLKCK